MADKFTQIVTGTNDKDKAKQDAQARKDAVMRYHAYNMRSDKTDNIDFDQMQNWTQNWWQQNAFAAYLKQLDLNTSDLQALGDKAANYLNRKYGENSAWKTSKGLWTYKPEVKEDAAAKMLYAIYQYGNSNPFTNNPYATAASKHVQAAGDVQQSDQKRTGELMGMSFDDQVKSMSGQEAAKMLIDISEQMKPLPDNDPYGTQLNEKLNKYRNAFFNRGAGKSPDWAWMNEFITAYIGMKPYYEDQNFLNTWRGIVDKNFNKSATTGQLVRDIRAGNITGGQNASNATGN